MFDVFDVSGFVECSDMSFDMVRRCQEMSVLHSSSMAWRTEVVQFAANHRCRIFNRKPRRRNPWQRGVTRRTSGFAKAVAGLLQPVIDK